MLSYYAIPSSFYLLQILNEISRPLHDSCLQAFQGTAHFSINAALFCGEKIQDPEQRQLLVGAGLYHLVVVAGIHLNLLEKIARRLLPRPFQILIPFGLGFYALVCAWDPPVVRAWIQSLLRRPPTSRWSTLFSSWFFCLALHPQWIHSLSLHLSVLAGLAFLSPHSTRLGQNLRVLLFHFPLLIGWTSLHPLIAVIGYFLTPFSLALWFTAGAFEYFWPRDFVFLNHLLDLWEVLLREANSLHPPFQKINLATSQWAWFFVALVFISLHSWNLLRAQKQKGF